MLKLSPKSYQLLDKGFNELSFHDRSSLVSYLENKYNSLNYPVKNPQFKDWTKEQFFFHFIRPFDLLCFFYYEAVQKNYPKILLDGLFTFNHIKASYEIGSEYDHCIKLKPILLCYAGNNIHLVDRYLPESIGMSIRGHRFLITAVNLIMAIRCQIDSKVVEAQTDAFLSKKNSKFDVAIIQTLLATLRCNTKEISKGLQQSITLHKNNKWLHDFHNPMSKVLPVLIYGLISIAFHHLSSAIFNQIDFPKHEIWWDDFQSLNIQNRFFQGENVMDFQGNLSFFMF